VRIFAIICLNLFLLSMLACGQSEDRDESPASETPSVPEDVAGPPAHAETSESGLAWVVLEEGHGDVHPRPEDQITVHYSGWQTNGEMFDSSVERGEPATFPLGRLIAGWVEGMQLMTEGEKRRFWIPGELAYDDRSDRPDAPKGMLVFDVELIEIHAAED